MKEPKAIDASLQGSNEPKLRSRLDELKRVKFSTFKIVKISKNLKEIKELFTFVHPRQQYFVDKEDRTDS